MRIFAINKPEENNINFNGVTKVLKRRIYTDGQKDIEKILETKAKTNPVVGQLPAYIFNKIDPKNRRAVILDILKTFDDVTNILRDYLPDMTETFIFDEDRRNCPQEVNDMLTNVFQKHKIIGKFNDIELRWLGKGGRGKAYKICGLYDREKEDEYVITAPTFRSTKDISNQSDIVEEISRMYGYENFTPEPLKLDLTFEEHENIFTKEYNVKLFEVLTGFKYIGEKIKQFEQNNSYEYVFGFEESYGCLVGTHARDKDAIVAVMKTCEAAAFYKSKGLSVVEQMENIYKKYGYYKEGQTALTFKGIEGAEKIKSIMEKLRNNPPMELAGLKVLAFRDYLVNTSKDFRTNETCETGLPKSNVLYFELENNSWCCVRPSGTEPKIKFYYGVCTDSCEASMERLNALKEHWGNI